MKRIFAGVLLLCFIEVLSASPQRASIIQTQIVPYIQSEDSGQQLQSTQEQLAVTQAELATTQEQLVQAESEIESLIESCGSGVDPACYSTLESVEEQLSETEELLLVTRESYLDALEDVESLTEELDRAVNPVTTPVVLNSVTRWADTDGRLIKDSGILVDDTANVSGVNQLTASTMIASTVTADVYGDLTGNVTGNLTGNVVGNVTGNVTGIAGSAHSFLDALVGDVTGYQLTTSVVNVPGSATVGGKTATAIAHATTMVETATSSGLANTLVLRDNAGSFTGNLTGASSLNILRSGDMMTGNLTIASPASLVATLTGNVIGNASTATLADNVTNVATKTSLAVAAATQAVEDATWDDPAVGKLVRRDPVDGSFSADKIYIVGAITGDTDAATKAYVDAAVSTGLSPIGSVTAYGDANITPLSGLAHTVDNIALNTAGLRVLLNGQTDQRENGVWKTSASSWERPEDYTTGENAVGSYVLVTNGNTYAGSSWVATAVDFDCSLIGTCSIIFQQFSSPGQTTGANVGDGTGIYKNKDGITLNFKTLYASNGLKVTNGGDRVTIATDVTGTMTAAHITATNSFYGNVKGNVTGNLTGNVAGNVTAGTITTNSLSVAQTMTVFGDITTLALTATNLYAKNAVYAVNKVEVGDIFYSDKVTLLSQSVTVSDGLEASSLTKNGLTTKKIMSSSFDNNLIVDVDTMTVDGSTITNGLSVAQSATVSQLYVDNGLTVRSGSVTITPLAGVGVVHTDAAGILSKSQVVNADITDNTITNAKLATVASANTLSAIVARDMTGSFTATDITATGTIYGNVIGNFSGSISIGDGTITNQKLATYSSANEGDHLVLRDASGDFAAGKITATNMSVAQTLTANSSITTNALYAATAALTGAMQSASVATSGAITSGGVVTVPVGSVVAPSLTFSGDTNTGIYHPAPDTIALVANGVEAIRTNSYQIGVPFGSAVAPAYTFSGDTNTGIYRAAADTVGIAAGGTETLKASSSQVTVSKPTTIEDSLTVDGILTVNDDFISKNIICQQGVYSQAGIGTSGTTTIPTGVSLVWIKRTYASPVDIVSRTFVLPTSAQPGQRITIIFFSTGASQFTASWSSGATVYKGDYATDSHLQCAIYEAIYVSGQGWVVD